ncbi:RNA-binding protein [bacterium]|nr:RNA-binding protein [bacterium]
MNIYAGNLSYSTTEAELNSAFAAHGIVQSCRIISDRDSGRSKGFGFVEMSDSDAQAAIGALNGSSLNGNTIKVNESQPRPQDNRNGGGGGRGRNGGGW